MTDTPNLALCSNLITCLKSAYTDDDTLIVDIWGPDMVMQFAKETFETDFTREQANELLKNVAAQFPEGGFMPINPEILAMVEAEIIKIPDTVTTPIVLDQPKPAKD
jgi:hypothetical protein